MLCNQNPEAIGDIARALSKEPDPRGAAARAEAIEAINHENREALEIAPEPSTTGHPGHVAIRFVPDLRNAAKDLQRRFRERLIEAFGRVSAVETLRNDRCEPTGKVP